jgi:hypothetical protein
VSNRKIMIIAFIGMALSIAGLASKFWQHSDPASTSAADRLLVNCRNEFAAARQDLNNAIQDLQRGQDEEGHFEAFRSRMDATFLFCFPYDDANPDNTPRGLLSRGHAYPTPTELEYMASQIDDGWNKSTIGQPWKGATHL